MVHDFNVAARAVRSECDASAGRFTRDSRSDEVGMGAVCPDAAVLGIIVCLAGVSSICLVNSGCCCYCFC